jgi:hypothetical protein
MSSACRGAVTYAAHTRTIVFNRFILLVMSLPVRAHDEDATRTHETEASR